MADGPLDVERLRLSRFPDRPGEDPVHRAPPRHSRGELFLKGPIPLAWLRLAAEQPGKALVVAIELWFRAGIEKRRTIRISLSNLRVAPHLSRSSASRGLAALERAGLVTVVRRMGQKPTVTLQDAPSNDAEPRGGAGVQR